MNAICRLFLEYPKVSELFCLLPAKIIVRLPVCLEGKLTATNHSKARQVFICFRIGPSAGGHSIDKGLYDRKSDPDVKVIPTM